MKETNRQAAPESGEGELSIEEIMADPEVAALLDFEPVPRQRRAKGAWTPELQRQLIALITVSGSHTRATATMGKDVSGATKLYRTPGADSFRAAWDAAVALAEERGAGQQEIAFSGTPPSIDRRIKHGRYMAGGGDGQPEPGQRMNEFGEWEEADSIEERGRHAIESVRSKLLRARRHFLREISPCPGKRAAFEILTELPVDWDKAAAGKPQADEPYMSHSQMRPDMVLTAESGMSWGVELGYGPARVAEARAMLNEYRAEQGLEPVDWSGSGEDSEPARG